jgi:DNA-binding HxlR family transcriptional regulator
MKRNVPQTEECPTARSLDAIGERWSLLIVRDAFAEVRRFSEFQRRLGIAKNILSCRLKALVSLEVLRVEPASDGSAYQEYVLTQKGRELRPVLDALANWGRDHLFDDEHSLKATDLVATTPSSGLTH